MNITLETLGLTDAILLSYGWNMGVEVEYTDDYDNNGVETIGDLGTGDVAGRGRKVVINRLKMTMRPQQI